MNKIILRVSSVFIFVAALSCKKQAGGSGTSQADTTGIVGEWTWIRSNFLFNVLTPRSGAHRALTFTATGAVYIKHNDSTGQYPGPYIAVPPLSRLALLSGDATDTLSYHFGAEPVGCPVAEDLNASFTALVIGNGINQFRISHDTLYLVTPPCLAQPDSVTYVRSNGSGS